jgi:hypothetical protein
LHEEGTPFPSEAIPSFDEDMAPVDQSGKPMVVDPGSPWQPRPASIGPVRVWGYVGGAAGKPLAHTKLLLLGKVAWFKNYAWPEGGDPGEYQEFIPELAWFGSANWTISAAKQHLEMGAFTTDRAFVRGCLDYVPSVVLESEPLGSAAPNKTRSSSRFSTTTMPSPSISLSSGGARGTSGEARHSVPLRLHALSLRRGVAPERGSGWAGRRRLRDERR